METRKWRIYYGDGSVFTDDNGSPWDAPRTDVQCIAQTHERIGWQLVNSADQYYWESDTRGWYSADGFTFYDHLIRAKQPLVVFGRMMSNEEWANLIVRVKADLPTPKSGWLRNERRDGE